MFYSINMLNNWAFAFQISVPVHIILRSFGSVTTMLAGWLLAGKTYSRLQVVSVGVLTLGVGVSAWADAVGKVCPSPSPDFPNIKLSKHHALLQGKDVSAKTETSSSTFAIGLSILLLAQLLSAYMGVYVQETYAKYGASWTENLFYSHFLSLPLFLPLAGTLRRQYSRLTATPAAGDVTGHRVHDGPLEPLKSLLLDRMHLSAVPSGVILLFLNALTQMACISGVNLLSATSSAVTVTIVLNIRKLVSFVLSTVIFGHSFSGLMMLGSALVFGSGALYGWETSWRIPSERRRRLRDEAKKDVGK